MTVPPGQCVGLQLGVGFEVLVSLKCVPLQDVVMLWVAAMPHKYLEGVSAVVNRQSWSGGSKGKLLYVIHHLPLDCCQAAACSLLRYSCLHQEKGPCQHLRSMAPSQQGVSSRALTRHENNGSITRSLRRDGVVISPYPGLTEVRPSHPPVTPPSQRAEP